MMLKVSTMEEQLQEAGAYVTRAHAADWRSVDTKNGDLLYVGSSSNLRGRLTPNHLMWSVYAHLAKHSPFVCIAAWPTSGEPTAVECAITRTCTPLWSNASNKDDTPWAFCAPSSLCSPELLDLAPRPGVYAWLYLPPHTDLCSIMIDGAHARAVRRLAVPRVWRCPVCTAPRLMRFSAEAPCQRCGAVPSTEEARAKVNKAFARKK